ncbi:MAG: T9SS type A sorting domain-containing protein [Fibrobacteres bacterium]|nr:T9SS type A sorting domain-containing protein [Fibrobacterota bacterium]
MLEVYPNPSSVTSTVQFNIEKNSRETVKVYDMRGKLSAVLHDGCLTSGLHSFKWNALSGNGAKLAAGVYFVKLDISGKIHKKRVIIL